MENDVINAAFSGLFHDTGKILQRSQADPTRIPLGSDKEGQPVHAIWTQNLADEVRGNFKAVALQSVYHHQPDKSPAANKRLSLLTAVADKLSAGERADEDFERLKNPPKQMLSIFSRIGSYRNMIDKQKNYLPLNELELKKEHIFPSTSNEEKSIEKYEKLSTLVQKTVQNFSGDGETDLEQFLFTMEKAAWCVPSSYYYNLPDVSLYDHSRTTAAIAVCLNSLKTETLQLLLNALRADYSEKVQITEEQKQLLCQPAALLIGGDISRIQKFIYTVTSKKAAQSLRGRSFFLQILTETILRFFLREAGIPYTNVIYSGGGHFYLLAPLSTKMLLPSIQEKISRVLYKHFGVSLYLAIGSAEVPFNGFKKGYFPQFWNEMHQNIGLKKSRWYTEFGTDMHQLVFTPSEHGGNQEDVCAVCGHEKSDTKMLEGNLEAERICASCSSFANDFGKNLPQTAYIQLSIGEPEDREPGPIENVLAAFGIGIDLFDQTGNLLGIKASLQSIHRTVLWEINDPEKNWKVPQSNCPTSIRRHYLANKIPSLTFDEMQDDFDRGIQRLGALRMDVDNLGALFQTGFGEGKESNLTISRLSTLSFQLSLFFEGYLKKICEEKQNIYTVYTGGDDLFLIGPWQEMPPLAIRIRDEFAAYTCANPDLSISGGMTFIHGKYPLRQAAQDAGAAEEIAKNLDGKNAFAFLGEAFHWDTFSKLQTMKDRLKKIINDQKGPSSLLQLLIQLDEQKKEAGSKVYGRWLWMGDYQFTRMISQYKKNIPLQQDLKDIFSDIQTSMYENLHFWGKAARWAQLELRSKTERNS